MNAVIYARYSSYNQTERSIEGQIEDCMRYAEQNDIKIVANYIDRACSGTNAEHRPQFQQMVKDSERKQFDVVLVYKLDRFSRNRYDSAMYKAKLKKNDVKVVSVMENISEDPMGIILESMLEGMAEYYSANLSQNVKRGMKVARSRGTYTGGIVVFGYRVVNKKVEIDENEAEAVRYVFSEYAKGTRLTDIVDRLNSMNLKLRLKSKFSVGSLHNLLKNKKYIGEYSFDDEDLPPIYPRIIDDATFYAVQARIEAKKRAPAAAKAKVRYLLQGKLFCGMCGSNMVGESGKSCNGNVYHYYSCATRKKHHTCKKKNEKKDFLERYIVENTIKYVLNEKKIDFIAEKLVEQYKKDFSFDNVAKLESSIEKAEREVNASVDLMVENASNALLVKKLNEKIEKLSFQIEEMKIDLANLKITSKNTFSKNDYKKWLTAFVNGDIEDEEFRQRIIDTFINAVYLYDDKLVVYYNIKETKQVTYPEMKKDLESLTTTESNNPNNKSSDFVTNAPPVCKPLKMLESQVFSRVSFFFDRSVLCLKIPFYTPFNVVLMLYFQNDTKSPRRRDLSLRLGL